MAEKHKFEVLVSSVVTMHTTVIVDAENAVEARKDSVHAIEEGYPADWEIASENNEVVALVATWIPPVDDKFATTATEPFSESELAKCVAAGLTTWEKWEHRGGGLYWMAEDDD